MATTKITDLTAYTDPVNTDVLPIVDVTSDVTKKVSIANVMKNASQGTAAAPGIAFDGDSNTGIYSPGANQVAITTDGTQRLLIDSAGAVTIAGDLTVNGTTTNINTTNLIVEDKNVVLGDIAVPTDVTADGGGITLKGTTDKTINWVDSTDAWTSSERFSYPTGSAAAPTLTFTGDPNTGIYSPGADQVAISTGGSGRLFVDASGRVIIGAATASIGTPLEVVSTSNALAISVRGRSADNIGIIGFHSNASATEYARIQSNGDSSLSFGTGSSGSERLRITSAGLVGVGTSSPQGLIDARTDQVAATRIICNNASSTTGASTNFDYYLGTTRLGGVVHGFDATSSYFGIDVWNGSAATRRLTINAAGNIGIGTSSPSSRLSVEANSSDTIPFVTSLGTTNGAESQTFLRGGSASGYYYDFKRNNSTGNLEIQGNQSGFNNICLAPTSGRVGIGTTSPGNTLHLAGTNGVGQRIENTSNSISAYSTLESSGALQANISGSGFFSWVTGGGEKVRIDNSGRLLVGTSSSLDSNAPIQAYKASGTVHCLVNSGSLGNDEIVRHVAQSGSRQSSIGVFKHSGITNPAAFLEIQCEDGTYNYLWADNSDVLRISINSAHIGTTSGTVVGAQTSDERLKNVLGPVEYGLETIKQLEPVRYALKSEPDAEKLGFIAQQVQPLVPQSVFDTNEHIEGEPEDAPTKLGMEYVALIPVLVNAIKELSAEVDALKTQLT